jgi:hypothetical protein
MGAAATLPATSVAVPAVLAIAFTLGSGLGDAYGFVHASRIWRDDLINWSALGRSALGFAVGMTMQWIAIRYLSRVGITIAEMQTIVWFTVTMIGIAVLSRGVLDWAASERIVAIGVVCGLGWLIARTG